MSDENVLELESTLEEQEEQLILSQPDAMEIIAYNTGELRNVVYTCLYSESLKKHVRTEFNYIDVVENDRVIGRVLDGNVKKILPISEVVASLQPRIIKTRPVVRG